MLPNGSLSVLPMKKEDSASGSVSALGSKKLQIKEKSTLDEEKAKTSVSLSGKDKQLEILAQCLVRNSPMRVLMRATLDVLDVMFTQEAICLHQMNPDGSLMLIEEKGIHEELRKKVKIITPSSDYFWLSQRSSNELPEVSYSYKNISDEYTHLYQDLEIICTISAVRFALNDTYYLFTAWHAEEDGRGILEVENRVNNAAKVLISLLSPAKHQFLSNEIAAQSQALKVPMGIILRKYLPEIEK